MNYQAFLKVENRAGCEIALGRRRVCVEAVLLSSTQLRFSATSEYCSTGLLHDISSFEIIKKTI